MRTMEKSALTEPAFQTEKVASVTQPPVRAVDSVRPFILPATASDQTGTNQAPVKQESESHQEAEMETETDPVYSVH